MDYFDFGKTGLKISRFGLGCMRFPKKKQSDGSSAIDQDEVNRMVKYAYEKGINYYDTAYMYAGSEKALGEALKAIPRDKIILTSKLPMARFEKYEDCERFLKKSLDDLQTDYLDFYLFHAMQSARWNTVKEMGLFNFMKEAKEQGKIKYIGFSFHDNLFLFREMIDFYDWDMCQIQLNIMDEKNQAGVEGLKYAAEKNIPVVIMEPLRGGILANQVPEKVRQIVNEFPEKKPSLEWAFKWLYNMPEVNIVLSGVNSVNQLKQNIEIAERSTLKSLTDEELKLISRMQELFFESQTIGCTHCNYCVPCPQAVDIPEIFAFYNGLSIESYKGPCRFQYTRFKYMAGHGVDKCIECGECEEKCTQQLPIIDTLKSAHKELLNPDLL
jgi:predicted aldo/keto reductase-like oxidoreductase